MPTHHLKSMQFLREYSSDSEESHENETRHEPAREANLFKANPSAHSSPTASTTPKPAVQSKPQPPNKPHTLPNNLPPLDPKSLVTYSEEFSMNTHNKVAAFAYIPWLPSQLTQMKLRKVNQSIAKTLRQTVPNFEDRFIWNSSISSTTVAHGKFGLSNKNAINVLHVTLFPNLFGSSHRLVQMASNLERAVKSIDVPPSLIAKDRSMIDDLMGTKRLQLAMESKITVYHSPKSGSMFLGLRVKKYHEPNTPQDFDQSRQSRTLEQDRGTAETTDSSEEPFEVSSDEEEGVSAATSSSSGSASSSSTESSLSGSPEHIYLSQVTRAIGQQAHLADFEYNWSQFTSNPEISHDNSLMNHHASLLVCELKPMCKRLSVYEMRRLRKGLKEIPASFLQDITLETDRMCIQTHDQLIPIQLT